MGFFTWTLANRKTRLTSAGDDFLSSCKLRYGGRGYVICPDGTAIEEPCYEGYGMFDGRDVYELVVDWNKGHLSGIIAGIRRPGPDHAFLSEIAKALEGPEGSESRAQAIADDAVNAGTVARYLQSDWKRCLGIAISDGGRGSIPYPIKITDTPNPRLKYADLPSSISCQ